MAAKIKLSTISCKATATEVPKKANFYKVLALESETASAAEIKKAYRTLARQCHPDVCPQSRKEESTRLFVELHQAYQTLSDPTLRRMHDKELGPINLSRESWEEQLHGLRERSKRKETERERT